MFLADQLPTNLGAGGAGKSVFSSAEQALQALQSATKVQEALSNAVKGLVEIQDTTLKKQREITDGVVINSNAFQKYITDAYVGTAALGEGLDQLGVNISEITTAAGETSAALNKAVVPTQRLLMDQIEYSKATGIATADLIKTETTFMRIFNSQENSFREIQKITNESQKLGLDVKTVVDDVSKNIMSLQTFRLSSEGLTQMATDAASLRTSVDGIGALKLAKTLWDPEQAVKLSQGMQMYGGEVGKLGNFFELMRMGQYDDQGLQDEMLKVYEQAFKLDELGNPITPSPSELMRLEAQAKLMGNTLETAMQIGQERSKQSFIEEKIKNLSPNKFDKDQLALIKSVGEIKDGKISLNIPGVGEIEDVTKATTTQMKNIKDFQEKAKLDERGIAMSNLTIAETQAKDVRAIHDYLLTGDAGVLAKNASEQTNIMNNIAKNMKTSTDYFANIQEGIGVGDVLTKLVGAVSMTDLGLDLSATQQTQMQTDIENSSWSGTSKDYLSTDQPFTGSKLITGEKGTIQTMIFDKEDDFLAAPKLNEILNKAKLSFDTAYALNDIASTPLPVETKTPNETFAKVETTVNTNNTTEVKFNPIVIEVKGVDGTLKQMLEKGDAASLLSDKIREEFSKMPKIMGEKGVFGY
jgi:hypothetical protein